MILKILKQTWNEWGDDGAPQLSAALAYYTLLSLVPLLTILLAIAGSVLGDAEAQRTLNQELYELLGEETARPVAEIVRQLAKQEIGVGGTVFSLITLVIGASGIVHELQSALNIIWNVAPGEMGSGFVPMLKRRLLALALVFGTGILVAGALLITVLMDRLWPWVRWSGNLLMLTVTFALIFKVVPYRSLKWKDVAGGAAVTALLFVAGQLVIRNYLLDNRFASVFGTAGSMIALLSWIYYSALVFFFGAELTQVWTQRRGELQQGAQPASDLKKFAQQ